MQRESYPNIDTEKTGLLLKHKIQKEGYTVKDIQKKLLLSCPQPVYRWYHGQVLPSVNHLYVLSRLLDVHMEDLLVAQSPKIEREPIPFTVEVIPFAENASAQKQRMLTYFRKLTAA